MSKRELRRVDVLSRVASEELKLVDAGRLMQLSYRQAKRIWQRYEEAKISLDASLRFVYSKGEQKANQEEL